MNLRSCLAISLGLIILAGIGYRVWRPQAERQVRRRLTSLLEHVNKAEGESAAIMALKMHTLPDLFAPEVEIELRFFPANGAHSAMQLASQVARLRPGFRTIELSFYDTAVNLPTADRAVVTLTARLALVTVSDMSSADVRELLITLDRTDDGWRFSRFEEVAVFEQ